MKVFPPFRLDAANQCLWRGSARISLPPKAFAILAYLVEHSGRLVTQEELLQSLWGDTHVQPEVLRKYILDIRRILEDPPREPRFVETVPKRGYRFIATVRDETSTPSPPEIQTKGAFVGRESALNELNHYLVTALGGQRQIVFVTGEAGIGKTSLVDAFHEQIRSAKGVATARGQCVEGFGGKEAYYPVLEALGLWIRGSGGEGSVAILAAQAPTWLVQFPAFVKPEQREDLLRQILGANRERMVREFSEIVEAFAADRPFILILEDLQWVDDSTLDLISALARRRAPARFLLVATYRPVEAILSRNALKLLKQDLMIHRLCQEIALDPLQKSEVEEYLAAELSDTGLARVLSGPIYRHSEGNPLFMTALVDHLRQQGVLGLEGGRWQLATAPEKLDPGVPESLQEMLQIQLEQLDLEEQRLLRAASVSGQRFSAWAAGAMLDREAGQVEESCERLATQQQFLYRAGIQELGDGSASAQYEFKHALYREVLYRGLAPIQRGVFHLRMAQRLEALTTPVDRAFASELALHFEAGRDYPRAIRYLLVMAGNAARRYAHRDAIQVLHHALELLEYVSAAASGAFEIEILEKLSDVLYAQGEMQQSAEVDQRVAELAARAGLKTVQVNALTRLARALAFIEPERCVAVCERAMQVSRTHNDPLLAARAEMLMACWHIVSSGWRQADAEACAAARSRIGSLSSELPAYYEILYAHVQCTEGDYAGAYQTAMAGIPKSIEDDNLVVYFSAHSSLCHALMHLGRWGELLDTASRAAEVAEKNGNAPWQGIFRAILAWLRVQAFDFEGAVAQAHSLLEASAGEPAGQVATMAAITAGYAQLGLGKPDMALETFREVCQRRTQRRFFLDWYWRAVARFGWSEAAMALGELEEAVREAETALESAKSTADPALLAMAWGTKLRVEIARRAWEPARQSLGSATKILTTAPVPFVAWKIHADAWELYSATRRPQEAEEHRRVSASIMRAIADSFANEDPLREVLLEAPAARRVLQGLGRRANSS
jgi:DNA-binding winged helix-turn-helix (wHTH) protein/tetratricopeptide (TPR) repeat protein